ncbi:hypothetical protein [Nitrosomonas sp. Nm166]|uniref:hypothetical protein n=1 Tax=Nitrosomonas sp. Nm166 TaxID=1881054 RepID=UPI0008DF8ABA|nr:hypothetical protein [Nitrosomonas sp. Nm166]SFF10820.1 hypothetical protein SAMN05428977_10514 [Nitrosomonas sp. Nm166]
MSDEIGTYGFLPWLRQGVANNISSADLDTSVKLRTSVHLELALTGKAVGGDPDLVEPIPRDVALYGPGDIIGIDSKAIIKNEPRNWITNFETNYMPYVDFYDEDFPWRYTPAAPDKAKHRLRPWICLVVLKEDEFKDGQNMKDRPLPYFEAVNAVASFPPAGQLWAWAHVHTNRDIVKKNDHVVNTDKNAVISSLQSLLNENPDLAYSRILCPRKLDVNTAYHAFLVPVFETGRLAGLGHKPEEAPADVHATFSAWGDYTGRPEPQSFPYYHRWYFRTGTVGDFEYLVRLLKPQPMDSRVGRRDMDVQKPAVQIRGITDADLGGILKLGGALKIPFDTLGDADKAEVLKYDGWAEPYPHDFQRDLASFINLADNYQNQSALDANQNAALGMDFINDPDPLITAPLYGRWHSMTQRLEMSDTPTATSRNWVHELNLDPRWRVTAGYGTGVVQKKQEEYMDAAWDQIGDVLAANRKIRFAQFAWLAGMVWHSTHLTPVANVSIAKAIALTRPLHARVLMQGKTLLHTVKNSLVPPAALSSPMRRVMRSSSRIIKYLPFTDTLKPDTLITRLNDEEITVAPPKTTPEDLPTVGELVEDAKPEAPSLIEWIAKYPWLIWLVIVLLLVLLLFLPFSWILLGAVALAILGLAALAVWTQRWKRDTQTIDDIKEENQSPDNVNHLPKSPDFQIIPLDIGNPTLPFTPTPGATDSVEGIRFKEALKDTYEFVQISGEVAVRPVRTSIDLAQVAETTLVGINPTITLPRLVLSQILIPIHIAEQLPETFTEAMAYPVIDIPMYKPLVDISSELFLPNINFVPQNSISLLETNQKFIEAYMIGLNHEFARELLWREYPTDQRGSYFRQFWDVSSYLNKDGLDEETLREKLRDIPPLHRWSRYSELGEHDHRETEGETEEELVLVIRGELLKKYPTAVIYAHRAKWQLKENGEIDNTKERVLVEDTPIENHIKTPLYEAKVHPDINFFGFDITAAEAKGGSGENPGDDPGWFFVIKERPGEPRFGLDIDRDSDINLWNDLSWDDALPGGVAGEHLQITNATPTITLTNPAGDPSLQEKLEQYEEDKHITWSKDTNAAQLAYILYQVPVLVAVHASEMLPKQ